VQVIGGLMGMIQNADKRSNMHAKANERLARRRGSGSIAGDGEIGFRKV
jgi:hypothetical protein